MNEELKNTRRALENLLIWADQAFGDASNDPARLLDDLLGKLATLTAHLVEAEQTPPAQSAPDVQASSEGGSTFLNVRKGHGHVGMQIGVIYGDAVFGRGVTPSDMDGDS